jgi:hypothetical protein
MMSLVAIMVPLHCENKVLGHDVNVGILLNLARNWLLYPVWFLDEYNRCIMETSTSAILNCQQCDDKSRRDDDAVVVVVPTPGQ